MRRLGHFDVHDRLGEGGMGVVYRATDRRTNQAVALKVLHPEFQFDEERRARFLREGQAAQAVEHSGVVAVREIGEVHLESGDRTLFLSLELVPGRDLLQLISRDAPQQRWVAQVGLALAEALEAIDRAGLVHRDVKPGNILATSKGAVKLLDLGLALRKRSQPESLTATEADAEHGCSDVLRTQVGSVVGTPGYAPPEQLRGETVDHRSDLYAMGATLFQMLTGALPFSGQSTREILSAIERTAERSRAEGRSSSDAVLQRLREKAPGVSTRFAMLVAALMSPDPTHRPQDAGRVAAALRELLTDDEELDRPLDGEQHEERQTGRTSAWMRLKDWWDS